MDPTKPGYKTSEFWLVVLANFIGVLIYSGAIAPGSGLDQVIAFVASVLATMGYTWKRSNLKEVVASSAALTSSVALKAFAGAAPVESAVKKSK